MNSILFFQLVVLLVLRQPVIAQQAPSQRLTVVLSSPDKPGKLNLKLVNGSIKVEGYNGTTVLVNAVVRGHNIPQVSTSVKRDATQQLNVPRKLDITTQEKNNQVDISSRFWQQPVDFTIKVPWHFSLQLATVDDGDIIVENVIGNIEASNVAGSIRLYNITGSALINTVNGELVALFKNVTPGLPMAFSTISGKIDLTLPVNTRGVLKMRSDFGALYSDFAFPTSDNTLVGNQLVKNGNYRVNTSNWTYGKLNGGGGEFTIKTLNGAIYIRKRK